MFINHQKAETKKYLSFVTYIYEISSEEEQQRLKALVNLGINGIESINYSPPVQHYCSLAWDQMVHEYQWIDKLVKNKIQKNTEVSAPNSTDCIA